MSAKTITKNVQKYTHTTSPTSNLPRTHNLTLAYVSSLGVASLMALLSTFSLLNRSNIYPTDELRLAFAASDLFNLFVGFPILLGSIWLARRRNLFGLLCWPAALFYVAYMYLPYLIGLPFNLLFLPYLLLVVISIYTLVGLIFSLDGNEMKRQFAKQVPARVSAGILIGFALLISIRQSAFIITALTNRLAVDALELSVWIADFLLPVPMLFIVGIQLWRRKALGYTAAPALFLGYGLLALSLIPLSLMQSFYTNASVDVWSIAVLLIMVLLCFIPLIPFYRGAIRSKTVSGTS